MVTRIIPIIISFLILGAHFLRGGNTVLTLVLISAPLLLFVKKPWSFYMVKFFLYMGALAWLYTAYELMVQRMAWGEPWLRMVLILAGVALFTAWSGMLMNSKVFRNPYFAAESSDPGTD